MVILNSKFKKIGKTIKMMTYIVEGKMINILRVIY